MKNKKKYMALSMIMCITLIVVAPHSLGDEPVSGTFTPKAEATIFGVYPANTSTSIDRPATNMSSYINSSVTFDVYFYLYNETGLSPTWTLIYNWSNETSQRFSVPRTYLDVFGLGTEFIWGNNTYTWRIMTRVCATWQNFTYTYTTNATTVIMDKNARMDVNNNGYINVFDTADDWAHHTFGGYAEYNRIYDVNNDNKVDSLDLSAIWGQKTI